MKDKKIVFLIGAGSTHAESLKTNNIAPLNKGFFKAGKEIKENNSNLDKVEKYLNKYYKISLIDPLNDFLENIMVMLYSDSLQEETKNEAVVAFQALINILIRTLAKTTNDIPVNNDTYLYKIIKKSIDMGVPIGNITIVTYNYDILIERILEFLYKDIGDTFNFPSCYTIQVDSSCITRPSGSNGDLCFPENFKASGISLLKMHGSLNWYSLHKSKKLSLNAIFNPKRKLKITSRRKIITDMTFSGTKKMCTYPIIIPPVINKAGVLHNELKPIWRAAEEKLSEANEVVFFGYSFPDSDIETANLIKRTFHSNDNLKSISVIDPNGEVLVRLLNLVKPDSIKYYVNAEAYLALSEYETLKFSFDEIFGNTVSI